MPGVSPSELFAYGQIYAAEGGNTKDPLGSASSGILQKTLDSARGRMPGLLGVKTPSNLTPDQRAAIYRDYINQALARVGGYQALSGIGNDYAAAVLADVLYRDGTTGGANIVRAAINQISPNSVTPTGRIDQATLDIVARLASAPAGLAQFLKAIGDMRRAQDQRRSRLLLLQGETGIPPRSGAGISFCTR